MTWRNLIGAADAEHRLLLPRRWGCRGVVASRRSGGVAERSSPVAETDDGHVGKVSTELQVPHDVHRHRERPVRQSRTTTASSSPHEACSMTVNTCTQSPIGPYQMSSIDVPSASSGDVGPVMQRTLTHQRRRINGQPGPWARDFGVRKGIRSRIALWGGKSGDTLRVRTLPTHRKSSRASLTWRKPRRS